MNRMQINQEIYGFRVTRIRPVPELEAELVEMTHLGSRAKLCWVKREEQNKTFSISFRTLPGDSTGVFHILEHSVLGGSEKYPVREPFAELLKSSVNTFLNAMTFPDKTMYPVASRNDKDFMNLIEVYLDAVFHPTVLHDERIFLQEGWHYEFDENKKPGYQGIVFNEMKGAMGDVDEVAAQTMSELLYPDSPYRFNSGGDPACIPTLSYQQFCEAHRKFYHPSNAYLFLDGAVNPDAVLPLLNRELSYTVPRDDVEDIPYQKPVAGHRVAYYELGEEEEEQNRDRLCTARLFATWEDREKLIAADLICNALCSTNESPFKKAILQKELAQDVSMSVQDDTLQCAINIDYINTSREKFQNIRDESREVFRNILREGINKEDLLSHLRRFQFLSMNQEEPCGIGMAAAVMGSWLYGGDPLLSLTYQDLFKSLEEKIDTDFYERLLEEMVSGEWCEVELLPSKTLGEEIRLREEKSLKKDSENWNDSMLEKLFEKAASLKKWQSTPDTPEALSTLPTLTLDDLRQEPQYIDTKTEEYHGCVLLRHHLSKHGIVHLNLYFKIPDLENEDYSRLSLMVRLFTKLPTRKHDVLSLQRMIKTHFGSLIISLQRFSAPEGCVPAVCVEMSLLTKELEFALSFVHEILFETEFNHPDKVKPILLQIMDHFRQTAIEYGFIFAKEIAGAHFFPSSCCGDYTDGLGFHHFIKLLNNHMQDDYPSFSGWAEKQSAAFFTAERLVCGLTCADDVVLPDLTAFFPKGEKIARAYYTELSGESMQQGIQIPAQVSGSALVADFRKICPEVTGSMYVLSHILTYEYLWNEIRVKGGAYGTGFFIDPYGKLGAYCYRDPTPYGSMNIIRGCGDFVRKFVGGKPQLDRFIIGSLAGFDPQLSTRAQARAAEHGYFTKRSSEDRLRMRRQAMTTTLEDLLALADVFEKCLQEGSAFCVAGSDKLLSSFSDITVKHI